MTSTSLRFPIRHQASARGASLSYTIQGPAASLSWSQTMAMLASNPTFPAQMGSMGHSAQFQPTNTTYRTPVLTSTIVQGSYSSPTESEFSESSKMESIRCVVSLVSALSERIKTLTTAKQNVGRNQSRRMADEHQLSTICRPVPKKQHHRREPYGHGPYDSERDGCDQDWGQGQNRRTGKTIPERCV